MKTALIAPAPMFALPSTETSATSRVPPGQESISLSARFTKNTINDVEGVDWKVKSTHGEILFQGSGDSVDIALQPGTYEITAIYANIQIDKILDLQPESHLDANFVLQAGELRVSPRLAKFDGSTPRGETLIYAMNGKDRGKLIATSATPGEIIKLAAGIYRLLAHFENSNTEAVTDVEVKAGIMRSVDVALHAGLAHITLNEPALAEWSIKPDQGSSLMTTATNVDAVLKPGHYTAEAVVDGLHISRSFTVIDGQEQLVVLPN